MNRNELLEKIAQIVLENPELKESMEMLMGGLGQTEEAVTQKPDMMYVLACRVQQRTFKEALTDETTAVRSRQVP